MNQFADLNALLTRILYQGDEWPSYQERYENGDCDDS
jgi:hypothetical protein